jgi:hypothetical protein
VIDSGPFQPKYRTTCLYCNGVLYPIALDPESAPWVCVICNHSWWAVELSEESRKQFRANLCDFGFGPHLQILRDKVLVERGEARRRGTSIRLDQVQLLPLSALKRVSSEGEFGAFVKEEITRKEA